MAGNIVWRGELRERRAAVLQRRGSSFHEKEKESGDEGSMLGSCKKSTPPESV